MRFLRAPCSTRSPPYVFLVKWIGTNGIVLSVFHSNPCWTVLPCVQSCLSDRRVSSNKFPIGTKKGT